MTMCESKGKRGVKIQPTLGLHSNVDIKINKAFRPQDIEISDVAVDGD